MTQIAKLRSKLKEGFIDGKELRYLLRHDGWTCERTRGSHEIWVKAERTFVLATHSKDLKPYQIKEARLLLTKVGDK